MKKYKPLGQFVHENHDLIYSTNEFLEKTAPYIGYIVHSFNSLEEELNSRICCEINERSDQMGVIVIHQMSYSQKVELFNRIMRSKEADTETEYPSLKSVVDDLKKCAQLRNAVVHAEWENMDSDGYTYVKIKFDKKGWKQEYQQFTLESLEAIDEFIHQTYLRFGEFEDESNKIQGIIHP